MASFQWRQWLTRFARSVCGKKRDKQSGRVVERRVRLSVEPLETRDLLALVIVPTFDSTITSDPNASTIEATINQSIQNFEQAYDTPITVDITYYEMTSGLGMSSYNTDTISYTSYCSALASNVTSAAQATAVASLPNQVNNPVNGNSQITLSDANYYALGLASGTVAGSGIYLNTSICNLSRSGAQNPNNYDLLSVVEHETDEVLGIGSNLNGYPQGTPPSSLVPVYSEDLFRYSSTPGVRSYDTNLNTQAYFSINGGTTDLAQFNQDESGDMNDWYSPGGQTSQVQDAFGTPGTEPNLGVEYTVENALGYALTNTLITVNSGNLNIANTTSGGTINDSLTIQADTALSEYIVSDPNAVLGTYGITGATTSANYHTVTVPFSAVTGTQVDVNTGAGNDSLTVDYSLGTFPQTVVYNGGAGTNSLTVKGGTFTNETYAYNGSTAGSITLGTQTVDYSSTQSLADITTGSNLTFTLPAFISASLQDDGNASNGISEITGASIVPTTFTDPSGTLTVTTAGSSNVQLGAMDNGFLPTAEVFSGQASDTFRFVSAAAVPGQASVTLTAATLNLNGLSPTFNALNGTGSITDSGSEATLTIGAANGSGSFSGPITNAVSLVKEGSGREALAAANSYSGATTITGGTLADGIGNALPIGTSLSDGGTLDLAGFSQQVSAVTGSGIVTDSGAGATFTVNNSGADVFAGTLSGSLALTKSGAGPLTLPGSSTNSGAANVNAGTLQVDGQLTSQVIVNNAGTLDGAGKVGALTVNSGGTLTPGDSAPGLLTVNGSLTMSSGSTFADQINGTAAGAGYGQLIVSGPVVGLNSATLSVSVNTSFSVSFNSAYELINNTGSGSISTTFNGLPEGATFTASDGRQFTISYIGGTGNDVVVTEKPMTLVWAGAGADNNWTTAANWVGVIAPVVGDTLTFGVSGALRITTDNNNYAAGTTFNSILFTTPGYTLNGNALTLTNGINSQPAGANTIDLPITLNGAQVFQTSLATSILDLSDAIHLAGYTLTTGGPGVINADAVIDGTGVASALACQGTGSFVIANGTADTYAGPTTVSAGVLEVDGSITSNVTVSGGTLTGTGSTGAVTGESGGTLYLGTTVSTLSGGALNLQSGSDFNVRLNSDTTYSSIAASSVTLGATLNLSSLAGFVPAGGDVFTIINNTGASAVNGIFVAGTGMDGVTAGTPLGEGAVISSNFLGCGHPATITYMAGPNHNSVAIVVGTASPLSYIGGASTNPNHFVLDENISDPVPTLEIWDNGVLVASQATAQTPVVQIGVAPGLDATLVIDYTNAFTVPVTFDGGTGAASPHTLTLENGAFTTATFNDSTVAGGAIALDSENINYADLTAASPAIIDTTTQANLILNLPASAQGNLADDAASLPGVSQINTTNSTFADATFENPSAALTVNGGGNGLIQLGAMDPSFNPATEIFSGQSTDTFQLASASAVPSTTSVTVTTAELDLNGLNPTINALNGNGVVSNSSGVAASVLSVGATNGSGTFSGAIKDGPAESVGLTKLGIASTETLSGASNTYSGPTIISAGVLQAGAANALSAHSDVADNATLDLKGASQTVGALSGSGIVTSSAAGTATLTVGADNGAGTFSGVIKNGSATSVALAKSGTATEIFNSTTNTYSGGTTVSAGILQIGDGTTFGSVGTAGVSIGVNGTLQIDSPANSSATAKTFANNISGVGSISVISANAALGLGAVLITGVNSSFTGALNISGGSYQLGAATALGAPAAINITGGQLYFGAATSLTVNAPVAVSTTGYLDGGGATALGAIRFSGSGDVLAGTVTVSNTALVTAFNASSGAIQGNITGTGTLEIGSALSAETIILTGSDGVATTINGSTTLQVGSNGTTGALTAAVTDNGNLVFKRSDIVSVGVSISGTGALTQAGNGALVLPNTNIYSYGGATTASSGVLQVDGSIASSVTVSGTGQLTGTGAAGNVTTTASSTVVAPGDAPNSGTLTANALTLSAGAAFNIGISGVNTSSQVIASGAVSLNAAVLNLATVGGYIPNPSDVYTIIVNNGGSAVSGNFVAGAGIDNYAPGAILLQGADLSDDFMGTGRSATLVYNYGPNGDSVAVEVSAGGKFRYNNAGTGNHNFLLKENGSTQNFELYDNNSLVATQPIALTTTININLSPAQPNDAALTIDYGGGAFTNKVFFDGGTGTGTLARTLTFENSAAATAFNGETFAYTSAQAGNVQLDIQSVFYNDLSSIADAGSVTAANVTFTLPASAQATFGDDGVAGNGLSKVTSQNGGFATTTFADPSTSLTVQAAGGSLVQLGTMDSAIIPTSEIFTGQSNDQFRLTSASALHSVTSVTLTAAILDLHGLSPTFDALNGSGTITNGVAAAATLTIGANGGSGNFSGVIQNGTGVINLAKSGTGAETFAGANTYSGTTTINGGGIIIGVANALPIGSNLTINGAGVLDLSGNNQQVASVTGAGTISDNGGAATFTVNNSAADTFAGLLNAAANLSLAKTGLGTLTLTHANNSYGGSTTVSAGTLKQGAAGAVPGNPLIVTGTLDLGGFGLQVPSVAGAGAVTNSSSTPAAFTVNNTGADQFSGAITGNAALTEAGGGTLTLSKVSTYTGATTVSAGTIADGIANALPIGTALSVTGTLDLSGFVQKVAGVTGVGTVTDSGAAAVFTVNNSGSDTFAGTLSGALALTKPGAGTLILDNTDSYTGPTTISAGTLQLGNAGAIPAASNVADNAILDLHGNSVVIGALNGTTAGSVTSTLAGPVVLTIGATNNNGTFSGVIKNGSGVLGLTKTGTGNETLGGVNTYTGATEVDAGTLTVNGTLYSGTSLGVVDLASAGVLLNGNGVVRGQVDVQASSFAQNTHIDGLTITVPTAGAIGITVTSAATFVQIGVTKGVTVNGGNTTSTGILVNGSAMIFNSKISGHLVDVDVNGGSAVLQKDTLNAGTTPGVGWTGLQVENSAIVDAGQIAANATPLPSPPYASGNVGLYGDITGLFSGTPLGSSAHSTGGNTFNGYAASTATSNPTTVGQAIRDLNTGTAGFGALANGVETSFTYGGGFQLGRMDLTAQADTFNGIAKPTNAVLKSLVFDGQRDSAYGFVVYGVPSMTVTQSGVPSYVAPNNSYAITISYANTGVLPTMGVISEYVPSNETANLAADPGWVSMGSGLYIYNLGLLGVGASGSVQFSVTVNAKPTSTTLTNEATIEPDLVSGIVVDINYVNTTTTVSPNNVRWPF